MNKNQFFGEKSNFAKFRYKILTLPKAGASSRVSTIIEQMEERRQAVRNGGQFSRARPVYPWGRQIQPNTIQRSDITTAIDAEETFWRDIFTFDILNWEHRNLG